MKVITSSSTDALGADTLIIAALFEGENSADIQELDHVGGQTLRTAELRGALRSKVGELALFFPTSDGPAILVVGAGKREAADGVTMLRAASAATRYAAGHGFTHLAILDPGLGTPYSFGQVAVEGIIRGEYDPGLMKTRNDDAHRVESITLVSGREAAEIEEGARIGQIVGEASAIARDLVNMPANHLTPTTFAQRAEQLAQEHGLGVEILDEDALSERGMGAILGVAAGSAEPPRVIVLRYGDLTAPIKLALVGKGITFDSGGLSIKPADGMMTMKGDMGGGAAVVAGMVAIAQLGIPNISVTGYVGATENMPGGRAMRPGDVLKAMNGETIEVLNTDAEGRLVLADVLSFAVSEGATHIVDLATLTGGAVVALGYAATLAAGRPAEWVAQVVSAAQGAFERTWAMPLYPEYREAMNSEVADIKNVDGRAASALTASAFLSDFVGAVPWTHLDIAGTSFATESSAYRPAGGTGVGVATLVNLVRQLHIARTGEAESSE